MNQVLGNHIGLVVNNQDPEGRNRLQIFIPHLSNTIYKGWNELLTDVKFKTFDESLFTGEVKETILSTLPWAEPAVPIWGGGTGAPVYDSGEIAPIPTDQYIENADEPLPPVEPPLPDFNESGSVDNPSGNLPPDQMPMWIENADNREVEVDAGINNSEGRFDGDTTSLGTGGIPQDSQGRVDPDQMYNNVLNIIKNNPNSIYNRSDAPINGARYGITGGAESWANFWKRTGSYESSYNNNTVNRSDPGGSFGILQVGPAQINSWANVNNNQDLARSYGLDPNRNYTEQDILASADLAVRAKLFVGDAIMRSSTYGGYRVGIGESNGLGATLGSATWRKLESNAPLAQGSTSTSQQVIRTTAMGVNAVGSVNASRPGGPMGVFSTPHVGAKVWVFFLGGNVQNPVYFANAYEPSNVAAEA